MSTIHDADVYTLRQQIHRLPLQAVLLLAKGALGMAQPDIDVTRYVLQPWATQQAVEAPACKAGDGTNVPPQVCIGARHSCWVSVTMKTIHHNCKHGSLNASKQMLMVVLSKYTLSYDTHETISPKSNPHDMLLRHSWKWQSAARGAPEGSAPHPFCFQNAAEPQSHSHRAAALLVANRQVDLTVLPN